MVESEVGISGKPFLERSSESHKQLLARGCCSLISLLNACYLFFSFLEVWRSLGLCDGWVFSTNSPRDTFLSSATQVLLWGPSWWRISNGSPRKKSWRLAITSGPSWSFYFSGMQNVQPPSLPQKGCYVLIENVVKVYSRILLCSFNLRDNGCPTSIPHSVYWLNYDKIWWVLHIWLFPSEQTGKWNDKDMERWIRGKKPLQADRFTLCLWTRWNSYVTSVPQVFSCEMKVLGFS